MNWWGMAAGAAAATTVAVAGTAFLRGRHRINGHVDAYARHWSDRPTEHPEDVLHYVALGDSAAQGVGASSVHNGYVAIVARRLQEATGRPVAITNLSVSGAVSDDVVRDQLDTFRALPFVPDIVTLDIGANDVVFPPYGVDSFASSLTTILETLPEGSFVADVPWMIFAGWAKQSEAMTVRAQELIAAKGHRLVQLHQESRSRSLLTYPRRTAQDWFHPNDVGYQQWADAFWASISSSGVLEELSRG